LHADTGLAQPILLFDGLGTILEHLEALFWMEDEEDEALDDVAQTAVALHPTMVQARDHGKGVLTKEGFAARLHSLQTFEGQLDWIASHRPPRMSEADWDGKIHGLLSRLTYFRSLANSHFPTRHCPGECILLAGHMEDRLGGSMMQEGGPGGCWRSIAAACMPVDVFNMPLGACLGEELGERAADWVAAGLVEAVIDRAIVENWVPGGAAPPVPDPNWQPLPRVLELWEERRRRIREQEEKEGQGEKDTGLDV
jgi:hypothetical protein